MDGWPLFEAYLRGHERRLAPATIYAYRGKLTHLERHVRYPFTHDTTWVLDQRHVRGCMRAHPEWSHWTANQLLSAAKAWHRFGSIEGWWEKNGISELSLPAPPNEPRPPLEPWQVADLLGVMRRPREARLLMLGLFAGCRISESTFMDAPHWEDDHLLFRGSKPPYKVRKVPLHPELIRYREVILGEQDLPPHGLKHVARDLRERVDFHWVPHALRRTFSQSLLDKGVAVEVVEALMGHAHRSMTLKAYGSISLDSKREAVALIPFKVRAVAANQLRLF